MDQFRGNLDVHFHGNLRSDHMSHVKGKCVLEAYSV